MLIWGSGRKSKDVLNKPDVLLVGRGMSRIVLNCGELGCLPGLRRSRSRLGLKRGGGGGGGGSITPVLHVTQAAVSEKGSMQTREGQIHQAKPKPPSPRQPAIKSQINR